MKQESAKLEAKMMLWQQTETESENLESAGMKNTARDGHLKCVERIQWSCSCISVSMALLGAVCSFHVQEASIGQAY